jgi:hypothetical protein
MKSIRKRRIWTYFAKALSYFSMPLVVLVCPFFLVVRTLQEDPDSSIHTSTGDAAVNLDSGRQNDRTCQGIKTDYIHVIIYIYTSSTAQGGGGSFKNRKPIGEVGCCESGMAERIH